MSDWDNIYDELLAAKVPLGSHESDLYAMVTPESEAIVDRYAYKASVSTFVSQVDGELWYDIPFAYNPFWKKLEMFPK